MANGITKPKNKEIQDALVTLVNEGFLKLPAPSAYLTTFMSDLAKEYARLRTENPASDKFQTLQTAITNARKTTQDPMITPSAVVALSPEVPGAFIGKRSINKYLEKLA